MNACAWQKDMNMCAWQKDMNMCAWQKDVNMYAPEFVCWAEGREGVFLAEYRE